MFILTAYVFFRIQDVVFLFFAAFIISSAANPLIKRLSQKLPREVSVIIFYLSVFLIFLLLFLPLLNLFINQLVAFLNHIPVYWSKIEALFVDLNTHQDHSVIISFFNKIGLKSWIKFIKNMGLFPNISQFLTSFSSIGQNFIETSLIFTKGFITAIFFIVSAILVSFIMLIDKNRITNNMIKFFPAEIQSEAKEITAIIARKVGGYVAGQIINMINLGTILFIILSILRVDYAIILAVVAAFMDIIPVVGATITVCTIALIVLAQNPALVISAVAAFLITNWTLDNFVKPFVFSRFLDIHPLVLIFSFLINSILFGFKGLLFAAPIAATFCVLIDEIYIKRINKTA